MPSCKISDVAEITEAIELMRGKSRAKARTFMNEMSPRELCRSLHAMRRWYKSNTGAVAKILLNNRENLWIGMNLDPRCVVGAFR